MSVVLYVGSALLLSGCGTSNVVAQWNDPQFAGQPPRGAKVMVTCRAQDATLRRLCVDRMSERLLLLGVQPLTAPDAEAAPTDEAALLQRARNVDATALLRTDIAPESAAPSTAPGFSVGIGGFRGGYGGGGGVRVGVSAPLGASGAAATGYGASTALVDVNSGRLMWSGRASASPSSDPSRQLADLAAKLLDSAHRADQFAR